METLAPHGTTEEMRRIVRLAAILNLAYFGIEFAVAVAIGSVSLFADSIDFLELWPNCSSCARLVFVMAERDLIILKYVGKTPTLREVWT